MKINLDGQKLAEVNCDYTINIGFSGGYGIQVEWEVILHSEGGEAALKADIEDAEQNQSRLARFKGQTVTSASLKDRDEFLIEFANGWSLRFPYNLEYESWNLWGPNNLRIVSMPGGELALWS